MTDRNERRDLAIAEGRARGLVLLHPRALVKLNKRILAEAGYVCSVKRYEVCTGTAECVHHTLGRFVTGDDPRYMVASCKACNLAIGEPMKRMPLLKPLGFS